MCADKNKVYILYEGYSHKDADNPADMRANCTCTLIQTHSGRNIIVDTMTAWDGQRLINAIKAYDLQPSDIDVVVCTHGHADHIGCNNLFTNAEWHIVGTSVHKRDKFLEWNFTDTPFQLDGEDVQVVATPGHTLSCVSVLIRNTNLGPLVGVCGDLFERMEDINNSEIWIEAGSEDQEAQRKYRLIMAERCTYIVPGHGAGFKMSEARRVKLWQDIQDNNI